MKIFISLLAGVVIGIAGTLFTYSTAIQKEQQISMVAPDLMPQTKPVTPSPFAPVSRPAESGSAADPTTNISSKNNKALTNTEALPVTDITNIKNYQGLLSTLQSLAGADSNDIISLLNTLPDNLYPNVYANALNTAIYQRWAEIDIDAALLHVVEIFENRNRRQMSDPSLAISILAAVKPDYVSEWMDSYASDNPALLQAASSGIASKDPEAFIRKLLANSDSDNLSQEDQLGTLYSALMQWTDQDPQSAFAFLNSEAEIGELNGIKENALYMWFDKDPDAAIVEIEALMNDPSSSPDSRMMLTDLYTRHLAETDPDTALQWALAQDDPMLRETSLMNIIYSWEEYQPDGLLSFIDQLPSAERDALLPMAAPEIASTMARNDPAGALAWAEQLPANSRQSAIMRVIDQWVYTDPASATEWLHNQPDTPENQSLLMNAAGSMVYRVPSMANEVFSTLPENLQNNMAEQMVFMQMDRGPDAVRDWLAQQTNPTVQEIGYITLDSMDPDIDAINILDRVASLQNSSRDNLLMNTISQRASTDIESVKQWITDSPLLTETERMMLSQMTSDGFPSRFGSPYYPSGDAGGSYIRR